MASLPAYFTVRVYCSSFARGGETDHPNCGSSALSSWMKLRTSPDEPVTLGTRRVRKSSKGTTFSPAAREHYGNYGLAVEMPALIDFRIELLLLDMDTTSCFCAPVAAPFAYSDV